MTTSMVAVHETGFVLMVKLLQIVAQACGFCVYGILVLMVSLWLLFPADSVQKWLEMSLADFFPDTRWTVGKVYFKPPLQVVVDDVQLHLQNSQSDASLDIGQMVITPPWNAVFFKNAGSYDYSLQGLGGIINGTVTIDHNDAIICKGSLFHIQLTELTTYFQEINRDLKGSLSGVFTYNDFGGDPEQLLLQGNVMVKAGGFSLKKPILGLDRLDFNEISTDFSLKGAVIDVSMGKVESSLLSAEFSGNIVQTDVFWESSLKLTGLLKPRPELFAVSKNNMLEQFVKSQLHNGRLSFSFSGSLLEPGILFQKDMGQVQGNTN